MQLSQALPEALRESRAVEVLERSLAQNRLGHGILLHGENPEFLEAIVKAISSVLLETDRDPYTHPDCFLLRPMGKARMIRIGNAGEPNTMRQLVTNIQKSSNQGGRKIGIVFEADRMNTQSANSFLKTLEEPPSGTTLFLLTTRPYDLLDTIRSRCLNFKVPSESEAAHHPNWTQWSEDYHTWLQRLLDGPNKKTVPHILFTAYGLNERFQAILAEMTSAAWERQKDTLPEHITSEEKDAMEVGVSRGYRKQLFAQIERETLLFARSIETKNPGTLPVLALNRATEALEHTAGLLELNFNLAAALEAFFLKSMSIWSKA